VAAYYVTSPSQLSDLPRIKKPGSCNPTGSNQEVRFPPKFIKHVCDVTHSAHTTVVKSQEYNATCWKTGKQLWRGDRSTRELLCDGSNMSAKLQAIEFVNLGVSALHPADLPAAIWNYVMEQEGDSSHGYPAILLAARFQSR
jgi:hypothetical protein